jgi:hypothetical protein
VHWMCVEERENLKEVEFDIKLQINVCHGCVISKFI